MPKNVGEATKKRSPRVTVSSGSVEAFIGKSLERARKRDRGERLPPEIATTFEDPADLVRKPRPKEGHWVRCRLPAPVDDKKRPRVGPKVLGGRWRSGPAGTSLGIVVFDCYG